MVVKSKCSLLHSMSRVLLLYILYTVCILLLWYTCLLPLTLYSIQCLMCSYYTIYCPYTAAMVHMSPPPHSLLHSVSRVLLLYYILSVYCCYGTHVSSPSLYRAIWGSRACTLMTRNSQRIFPGGSLMLTRYIHDSPLASSSTCFSSRLYSSIISVYCI